MTGIAAAGIRLHRLEGGKAVLEDDDLVGAVGREGLLGPTAPPVAETETGELGHEVELGGPDVAVRRRVLHQPAVQGRGAIPDLILQADEVVRIRAAIESILSSHTGQTVEALRADTDRDRVFAADAAIAYGLADEVLQRRTAVAA